jgi:hypothetical protein
MNIEDAIEEKLAGFTAELDVFCRDRLEAEEQEQVALMAMMAALNRQLAVCAVAFAKSAGVTNHRVKQVIKGQLDSNIVKAADALFVQTRVQ